MKHLLSILIAMSMSVLPALAAKTAVPTLQRVNTKAPMSVGAAVAGAQAAAATEQPASPLDEPFSVKYAYSGTGVSKNVVALGMEANRYGICSGMRYHRYWIATAAHCFEQTGFGTNTNPRVVAKIKQQENGVWYVEISKPSQEVPANATIYFYRNGYSTSSGYGNAEDIAIVGLDKEDGLIALVDKNIRELDASLTKIQQVDVVKAKKKASARDEQAVSSRTAACKKLASILNDKKRFLRQPLDDYHFMTFSIESARLELYNRIAKGYFFEAKGQYPEKERQLPQKYNFTFFQIPQDNNHTVIWKSSAPQGASGTPIVIGGYVVGMLSGGMEGPGITPGQGRSTALLTDEFTAFLKRHMGADYKQGLCLRSVANEESITQRTQP